IELFVFFFSSRRRHTRFSRDWSSDVCSSDLMAIKEMEKLSQLALEKWEVSRLLMLHVVGEKEIGEPVVVLGIASPHRDTAFQACRFLIDELKKTVPIWKKELYEDGSIWVNAHPRLMRKALVDKYGRQLNYLILWGT